MSRGLEYAKFISKNTNRILVIDFNIIDFRNEKK